MPSQKPVIALRLERTLHARVVAAARAEGRSPSNFIEQALRKVLGGAAPVKAAAAWSAVRALTPTPVRTIAAPSVAVEAEEEAEGETPEEIEAREFDPQEAYQEQRERGVSHEEALALTKTWIGMYMRDDLEGWEPSVSRATNGALAHDHRLTEGPITSAEFDVPGNWCDARGETRAVNLERYGEDEAMEYWAPGYGPHDAPVI
jgi:hypothetical protein